jgi:uncharacterized Zn finger protein
MFWKKIKARFQGLVKDAIDTDNYISNYDKEDYNVDVKIARHNYKMYQEDLKRRQQNLVEKWCKKIREASRNGSKHIETNNFMVDDDKNKILFLIDDVGRVCDFPVDSSMQYFQQYFEEKGFNVTKIEYPHNFCSLRISWLD